MRQAIMTTPGVIEHREVPEPGDLKPDEILLKIVKIGVCGTDIHVYHGEHPATPYPVVQGHEYSSTVQVVGSKVTKVKPGMRATARPQLVCGKCGPCKKGQYNACQELKVQGFQAPGVAQDYFVTVEDRIIPFPDTMTFEQGALIEPSAVGAHSTGLCSDLKGKNIVVAGAGTIGNLVAQFAKARGAKKVLITDLIDFRLDKAKECGIDYTLNVSENNLEDALPEFFGKEGFQVGFEAVGAQASLNSLVANVENGGEVVILGVFAKNPVVDMYFVGEHELKIYGSMMYKHEDYEEAVQLIDSGKIITAPLITKHFPFEEYIDAYHFIDNNSDKTLKVIIDL